MPQFWHRNFAVRLKRDQVHFDLSVMVTNDVTAYKTTMDVVNTLPNENLILKFT